MKSVFFRLLVLIQISFIYGQNKEELKPLRVLPIKGAWIKLEKNGTISDSVEALGYVAYHFVEFNPVTKLIKVSYANNGEWIPRGRGYFRLSDIEPFIAKNILSQYTDSTGDSIPYKDYLLKLSQIEKQKKIAVEKQQKENLNRLVKKYGKYNAKLILQNKIKIGMTKEMVIESWGKPEHISRTVTASVVHEQWVYGDSYLYFDNGILTAWQD
jgi:hypothetical protein